MKYFTYFRNLKIFTYLMSMLCVMGTGKRRFRFSDEQIMAAITFILFLKDPLPVQKLVRKEGRRPAILLGLRDNENDYGVIKVRE